MAWRSRFQETANFKPLFLTIYATVIAGIVFSAVYIFSAVYSSGSSSAPTAISSWLPQFSSHSPPMDQAPNYSQPKPVGVVLVPAPRPQSKLMRPIWEAPSSGSKMPPLNTFRLSKNLVQQRVRDNIIIVTFANYAFMDFILTWVKHLTDFGLDNVLVGHLMEKIESENLLHRAFSIFLFNTKYELLLQMKQMEYHLRKSF